MHGLLLLFLECVVWLPYLAVGDSPRPHDPSEWEQDNDSGHAAFGSPKHCKALGSQSLFWDQPGSPENIDFTLVSQCSFNRIWMLRHICKRWTGDIVIAVLLDPDFWNRHPMPLVKDCQDTVNEETGKTRTVTLLPYLNEASTTNNNNNNSSGHEKVLQFYPVNALRNYALCQVSTSHIFYTDMDLWPSSTLYHRLHLTKRLYPKRFMNPQHATVVPAFALESMCNSTGPGEPCQIPTNSVPGTFEELKRCVFRKKCHVFDRHNFEGHATTDYRNWVFSRQKNFRLLPCIRSNRYEPYLVLPASPKTPLFDEMFTGYGKNKIQHVVHLRMAGFRFSVLSYAYVIHYPHTKSLARAKWDYRRKAKDAVNEVDLQYRDFQSWLGFVYGKKNKTTPLCFKNHTDAAADAEATVETRAQPLLHMHNQESPYRTPSHLLG